MQRDICPDSSAASGATRPDEPDAGVLAATLCARLCHDLAGSLGGLLGALDLATEGADPEAMALAIDSARDLAARLRLSRAAWGEGAEIWDIASLLPGLPRAERLTVDCAMLDPCLEEAHQRLALGLLMAAATALPRGGRIILAGDANGLLATIDGPQIAWPVALKRCLGAGEGLHDASASPRDVGFALLHLAARNLGLMLSLPGDDRLIAA